MSIEKFFTALDDGKWHSIDELADQIGIQSSKITKLSELLAEYDIIEYQDNARRIKIEQPWRYLFPEEELTEPRSILATFVLPPRTSIDFQSTYISNISNFKIELSIRFNGKIEEMTVNF